MKYCLFVTPFLPHPTGGGSLMRASVALEVLSSLYPVVLVHAVWDQEIGKTIVLGRDGAGRPQHVIDDSWARSHSAAFFQVSLDEIGEIPAVVGRFLRDQPRGSSIEVLYAFRQHVAPSALGCFNLCEPAPKISFLDLDDDDSSAKEQFGALHDVTGDAGLAETARQGALRIKLLRRLLMTRFQHLFLASPDDCRSMASRYPEHTFTLLPNVIRDPGPLLEGFSRDPSRMLFVGTLSYLPNEDGIEYFAQSVLPMIRARNGQMIFRVVGMGRSARVDALAGSPGLTLAGPAADLRPEYAEAGMLVVPLRAGSGTRIKILEAFQHRLPVVSTSKGAEGLGVAHEEHLLIANSPDEMVNACLRLTSEPSLRNHLAEQAHAWVQREHSIETARRVICDCLRQSGLSYC